VREVQQGHASVVTSMEFQLGIQFGYLNKTLFHESMLPCGVAVSQHVNAQLKLCEAQQKLEDGA